MYESYIVDELGNPKYLCFELSDEEIACILADHPKWRVEEIFIDTEAIF